MSTLTKGHAVRIINCEGNEYACELIGREGTVISFAGSDVVVQVGAIVWFLSATDVEAI